MKALILTPAYSHVRHETQAAIMRAGLPWLPLYGHSDLVRVRSLLLTAALRTEHERFILLDADTVPAPGVLEALASTTDVSPTVAVWGLYPLRDGERWNVTPSGDPEAALTAIREGRAFPIRHGGLGLCAMHRESLERVSGTLELVEERTGEWWPFCLPFQRGRTYYPEDHALGLRLAETGTELWCNPTLRAGHAVTRIITAIRE